MTAAPEERFPNSHEEIIRSIERRRRRGQKWRVIFYVATAVAIFALALLLINIINSSFGYVLVENEVKPTELVASGDLMDLSEQELITILEDRLSAGLIRRFNSEQSLEERSKSGLIQLVEERVVNPEIIRSWNLGPSIFGQDEIQERAERHPEAVLTFRSWLSIDFLLSPQNPTPALAGIRTAFLGSLWMMIIVILTSFPTGVAAAIYLEEYADETKWYNRVIDLNIYNLAGVPSIIYGLLGLAIFVRALEPITNGRTVVSGGLTLTLLILPIIIINSREALRAIPASLRESSLAVGATKWQTIWYHVLPASFDRILTGTILAVSRAVGETAPLVVIGASTFITIDPDSIFSKFTTLPIQIYQWSARPSDQYRNVAGAAIIVLLVLMLSMNATAIILRNHIANKRRV